MESPTPKRSIGWTVFGYLAIIFILYLLVKSWPLAALGGLLFILVLYFIYPQVKGMLGLVVVAGLILVLTIVFEGRKLRVETLKSSKNDSPKSL
jgi:hypothetical protein